jgi:ubiquinone/menaquinone biosynthesis C-methylase UbiE
VHAVPGPAQSRLTGALAYDAIAADYDAQVAGDAWMRRVLHAYFLRVFSPGDRVLDVGCGTGIDALLLAQHGMRVVALDFSPAMIAELRARLSTAGLADRVEARVLAVQDLATLTDDRFDGLIAAFAGLSTLPDLTQFARDAARLVRPGGHLVLHLLNRFSLWEWLGYVSRGNWSAARQVGRVRTREFTIGGVAVAHTLYYPNEAYRRFFAGEFGLRSACSLGALRPPHTVQRLPRRVVSALEWLDVRTGSWPLLQHAGRFWVLDLERLPT